MPEATVTIRRGRFLPAAAVVAAFCAPALAAAQDRDANCSLLSRTGDHYERAPLAGFDPADPAAPFAVKVPPGATALVLCRRGSVLPQITDYRVPAELHLPLDITDERRVVQIDIIDGRLQATFRRGQASPEEQAAVTARVEEMQAALQQRAAAK